jgi:hypothetical protein
MRKGGFKWQWPRSKVSICNHADHLVDTPSLCLNVRKMAVGVFLDSYIVCKIILLYQI